MKFGASGPTCAAVVSATCDYIATRASLSIQGISRSTDFNLSSTVKIANSNRCNVGDGPQIFDISWSIIFDDNRFVIEMGLPQT